LDGSLNPVSRTTFLTFDKSVTAYQFIGIALNSIPFTSNLFQYIRFYFVRTGGSPTYSGYFLDVVKLEGGINPPVQFGTFLSLSDTPSSYSGQGGKTVSVKADESGLEFVAASGGASTFLALTDTPSTYVAQANKFPRVNGGETALVFDTVSPYDLDQEGATDGQVLTWVNANSRFEPVTPIGGSSNWTVVGSGIYRDSAVAIGRTTLLSNNTLTVRSKITGANKYVTFESDTGVEAFSIINNVGEVRIPNSLVLSTTSNVTGNNFTFSTGFNSDGTRFGSFVNPSGMFVDFRTSGHTIWKSHFHTFGSPTGVSTFGIHTKGSVSNANPIFRVDNSSNVACFNVHGNGDIFIGGSLNFVDAKNIVIATATGTKIGTATSQKLSFWNKTPIIQPTTGITGVTRVGGGGSAITDTDTFGGYTLQQIAAALINTGLLA
jgi:hypothetical protein